MDIHLDILLDLPNVTVFTCEQVEGFTVLKLKLLNEGISCPHCHSYTDEVHQNRPILVRDLPISGRKIYLQVPLVGHADPATTAKYNLRGEAVK